MSGRGRLVTVLERLANLSCSRPRRVAVLGGLLFVVVGVIGGPAPGSFNASNAFDDPGSQATRAREQIERATGEAAERRGDRARARPAF